MESTMTCLNDKKQPFHFKKKLKVPMYGCVVEFIVAEGVMPILDKLYKKYKVAKQFDGEAEGVVFSPDLDLYIILIERDCLTHNTIAHELYHTTVRITEDREIEDEEQCAWLNGWLAESIYKFLKNKNLDVK